MSVTELFDYARFAGMSITLAGEIGGPSRMIAEGVGEKIELTAGRCVHVDERGARRIDELQDLD